VDRFSKEAEYEGVAKRMHEPNVFVLWDGFKKTCVFILCIAVTAAIIILTCVWLSKISPSISFQ